MKRYVLSCLLILLVPLCLFFAAAAQESGAGDRADAPAAEKQGADATDRTKDTDGAVSGGEESTPPGGSVEAETKTDTPAKETVRKAERRKKAEEKKKEPVRQEETAEEDVDRVSGDNLLLIDHERFKYNRIPGITVKKDEPGEDIVKIPSDRIAGDSKEKKESEGIFGKRTRTIAGWGIVILIFFLFVIYSKTRSRHSKRKVVRTITKR